MAKIGIVTDSTCDLRPEELAALDVAMVPLTVHFGDTSFRDWLDLTPEEFYPRLKSFPGLPTTSQPSPADFTAAYTALAEQGVEEIVSIHLSAALSGTFESAMLAAKTSPVPIRVVDGKKASAATALMVKAAVEARDQGKSAEEIEARALEVSESCRLYFLLDTLDNLVKGGRAGKAQGLAASLLNIKAVLHFDDGVIVPFQKARGTKAAVALLAQHVAERSHELGGVKAVVIHALVPDMADDVEKALAAAGMEGVVADKGVIGAVIGTHAGPRALGVAYTPLS